MNRSEEIEAAAKAMLERWDKLAFYGMSAMHNAAGELRRALALPAESETCVWTYDAICDIWRAACGGETTTDGDSSHFCTFCGKRIEDKDGEQ